MNFTETSEEEQSIDRLLGELGIRLPAVELDVDGEDALGSPASVDPGQSLRLDELREWWPFPFS